MAARRRRTEERLAHQLSMDACDLSSEIEAGRALEPSLR
jgi:hypothetical protein